MPKLVISYRRQDSEAITGRIRDRLAAEFGDDSVFMDIDSIPIGVNFREHIARQLENADALFVIIGSSWFGNKKHSKRIQNPTDPVRIEVEKAFELEIPIWPILVNHAVMPSPDKLPDSLRTLSDCNAAVVDSGIDFHSHMDRVIRQLKRQLGTELLASRHASTAAVLGASEASNSREQNYSPHRKSSLLIATILFSAVVAIAAGGAYLWKRPIGGAPDPIPPVDAAGVTHLPSGAVDCSEEANLRSEMTTHPTTISFTNRAADTRRIYWLNFNGARVLYATLNTGQAIKAR
jgi:hypothetical protein